MARYDDKITAFHKSVIRESSGRRIVKTSNFVRNLADLNHYMSLAEANRWIKRYAKTYRDISTTEGEDRLWFQYNPNGGI